MGAARRTGSAGAGAASVGLASRRVTRVTAATGARPGPDVETTDGGLAVGLWRWRLVAGRQRRRQRRDQRHGRRGWLDAGSADASTTRRYGL